MFWRAGQPRWIARNQNGNISLHSWIFEFKNCLLNMFSLYIVIFFSKSCLLKRCTIVRVLAIYVMKSSSFSLQAVLPQIRFVVFTPAMKDICSRIEFLKYFTVITEQVCSPQSVDSVVSAVSLNQSGFWEKWNYIMYYLCRNSHSCGRIQDVLTFSLVSGRCCSNLMKLHS